MIRVFTFRVSSSAESLSTNSPQRQTGVSAAAVALNAAVLELTLSVRCDAEILDHRQQVAVQQAADLRQSMLELDNCLG